MSFFLFCLSDTTARLLSVVKPSLLQIESLPKSVRHLSLSDCPFTNAHLMLLAEVMSFFIIPLIFHFRVRFRCRSRALSARPLDICNLLCTHFFIWPLIPAFYGFSCVLWLVIFMFVCLFRRFPIWRHSLWTISAGRLSRWTRRSFGISAFCKSWRVRSGVLSFKCLKLFLCIIWSHIF